MTGVWEREIEGLLLGQEKSLRLQSSAVRVRRERVHKSLEELEEAEDRLLKILERHEKATRKLLSRRDDPEVVVRNYNKTTLYTYHADTRCGWVRNPKNTERILLSEARELGYGPCTSCGYRVAKPVTGKATS